MNVVFVGGGRGAAELLSKFLGARGVRVVGVVDPNPDADAMKLARQHGIATSADQAAMIRRRGVEVIVEVTGVPKVRQAVMQAMRPEQDLMTAAAARMMDGLLRDQAGRRNAEVADELSGLTGEMTRAIEKIDATSAGVARILPAITMVTLNASVEAARAGQAGAAFAVIVERMRQLIDEVRTAVEGIQASSGIGHQLLQQLDETERRLREAFEHDRADAA